MKYDIKLVYVDDKIDTWLDAYLNNLGKISKLFIFDDHLFKSSEENYMSLIENEKIRNSDIIIIDSKLFENASVTSATKFTGEEFKLISKTYNPFREVIVISQNDDLEQYGVLRKFKTIKRNESYQDAIKFYDTHLLPALKSTILTINANRNSVDVMKENKETYKDTAIVEQTEALVNKIPSYKELTDEKIDELIDFVKQELMS